MTMDMQMQGPKQTAACAQALGGVVRPGDLLGLRGDLGAGKTAFVQGLARGLAVPQELRVTSPTFTLVNEYRGGRIDLIHADLYRIENAAELDQLGLYEACDSGDVVAIEWCEKYPVLPVDHLLITLSVVSETVRRLVAEAHGPTSEALLALWESAVASE